MSLLRLQGRIFFILPSPTDYFGPVERTNRQDKRANSYSSRYVTDEKVVGRTELKPVTICTTQATIYLTDPQAYTLYTFLI